ncbi:MULTISPECIES: hypothetical protein [Lysinibacillus]|uniref:Uncharacterized protein n=1 Tax=Lysinibacillus capsici TaxID=2115968 RepID=A0ABY8KK94_9BACI|nr:hypothetical protein [Lysinibacillus capsici]WGF39913.1 hypothetical protein QBO96_06505 [Lysinibacillus capsici]
MDIVTKLKLEIAVKKACIEDLRAAIKFHEQQGTYHLAAECAWRIKQAQYTIRRLEVQLQDNSSFGGIIKDFTQRGIFLSTVKKLENQS